MIAVSHLSRRFGAFTAVDDVSFRLERGEVVGFLGVNGAGKSTTMRMLTGFLPATRGSIEIAGHDVLTSSIQVRSSIGYLPEGVPLYREHRVEEMLRFQGRLHGMSRADAKTRTGVVLDRVGLLERRRSIIGKLSKGQRQRVGLAVALLPDPPVLILDEPTSGLDPLQRLEVRELVGDLADDRTVLLSSHILPEIESVCPRVIVLHQGRVVADGTHAELATDLGEGAFVSLVAVVEDVERSRAALVDLPGVSGVECSGEDREARREPAVGGSAAPTRFVLRCKENLCAAVGQLAAGQGWTIHELAFTAPTLEGLFARLAVGREPQLPAQSQDEAAAELATARANGDSALGPRTKLEDAQ